MRLPRDSWNVISMMTVLGFIAAFLCGCSQDPYMEIHSSYGPGAVSADPGRTFAWLPRLQEHQPDRPDAPAQAQQITSVVEERLTLKGYVIAADDKPDFWVDYHLVRRVRGEPRWGQHFGNYEEGSLIIDLINPKTRTLIWRGSGQARLDLSQPTTVREERLSRAVERILDKYPSATATAEGD